MGFSFKDMHGNEYNLKITLPAAERIDQCDLSELGIKNADWSFLDPPKEFFTEHLSRLGTCAALAYLIAKPELSQEEFASNLDGQSLNDLQDALWDAVMDFFPRWRTVLSTLRDTHRSRGKAMEAKLTKILNEDYAEALDATLEAELSQIRQRLDEAKQSASSGTESTKNVALSDATGDT